MERSPPALLPRKFHHILPLFMLRSQVILSHTPMKDLVHRTVLISGRGKCLEVRARVHSHHNRMRKQLRRASSLVFNETSPRNTACTLKKSTTGRSTRSIFPPWPVITSWGMQCHQRHPSRSTEEKNHRRHINAPLCVVAAWELRKVQSQLCWS